MINRIETYYKGYHFRSRIEARWAVFFDRLNIQWEYEKEGYELGKLGRYLPDFWLSSVGFAGGKNGMFMEIKSTTPSKNELLKLESVATHLNARSGILVNLGNDSQNGHVGLGRGFYRSKMVFTKCPHCGEISFDWSGINDLTCHVCETTFPLQRASTHSDIQNALQVARSARFEFREGKGNGI